MGKKEKQTTVNHIQNLNMEIDYNKLAEAIVEAEHKAIEESASEEKLCFWKKIWYIIINKKQTQRANTVQLMAGIISWTFNALSVLSFLGGVFGIVSLARPSVYGSQTVASIALTVAFSLVLLAFALMFRACANEISQEERKDYIVAIFSGLSGFAAVILAIVALFK